LPPMRFVIGAGLAVLQDQQVRQPRVQELCEEENMSQSDWNDLIKDLDGFTNRMKSGADYEAVLHRLGTRAASLRLRRQSERTQALLAKQR